MSLLFLSLSDAHAQSQKSHALCCYQSSCLPASLLWLFPLIFTLWSVTVQMMIIRELYSHLFTDIMNVVCFPLCVCVCVCVCFIHVQVPLKPHVDTFLSFSVTLIILKWTVTVEIFWVLSDVFYPIVVKVLLMVLARILFIHFFALCDWQLKKRQYDSFKSQCRNNSIPMYSGMTLFWFHAKPSDIKTTLVVCVKL